MIKLSSTAMLLGAVVCAAAPAAAQTPAPRYFVDINGGAQPQSRTLATATGFDLYNETATVNTAQAVNGSGLFDARVGYRWHSFYGSIGVSTFRGKGDGSLAASIPNPNVFGNPAVTTLTDTGLKRSETGTHLSFGWLVPLNDKADVDVFIGPSFIRASQEVMTADVVPGTQSVTPGKTKQRGTANGVNVGLNASYMLRPMYGVGLFVRYAGGSFDIPAGKDLKAGGFQFGGGLRLRFSGF